MHCGAVEVVEREVMADWIVGNWEDLETVRQPWGAEVREAAEVRVGRRRMGGRERSFIVVVVGGGGGDGMYVVEVEVGLFLSERICVGFKGDVCG